MGVVTESTDREEKLTLVDNRNCIKAKSTFSSRKFGARRKKKKKNNEKKLYFKANGVKYKWNVRCAYFHSGRRKRGEIVARKTVAYRPYTMLITRVICLEMLG